jgi:hypothetical protein
MTNKTVIVLLAAILPCVTFPIVAMGQGSGSYQCTLGDQVRRVEILSEPGATVPCEVHYYKDTEAPGDKQVLWSAANQEGYCESQTEAFIAKLQGWGWDCGQGAPAMPAPEAEVEVVAEDAQEAAAEDAADDVIEEEMPAQDDTSDLLPVTPSE